MSPSLHAAGRRRNPVHHFLVDRGAHRPRISPVTLERRARTMFGRVRLGKLVEFLGRNARANHRAHLLERAPDDQPRPVHLLEFRRRFTDDHLALPRAPDPSASSARLTSSMLADASTPQARPGAGSTSRAASSAARTPRAAPSRLRADRRRAESASRRPGRRFPRTFGGAS